MNYRLVLLRQQQASLLLLLASTDTAIQFCNCIEKRINSKLNFNPVNPRERGLGPSLAAGRFPGEVFHSAPHEPHAAADWQRMISLKHAGLIPPWSNNALNNNCNAWRVQVVRETPTLTQSISPLHAPNQT
jgi:hypothetical protein